MNNLTNNPDQALIMARRLIDDRIQAAQRRAQTRQLRAARRAERRQSHNVTTPASSPTTMPRATWTSFPSAVLDFLHGAR